MTNKSMYAILFIAVGVCLLPINNKSQSTVRLTTPIEVLIRLKQDTIKMVQSEYLQQQEEILIQLKTK